MNSVPSIKPDKLFRLIAVLDKSEKGFIKKFASLHIGDNANSLRLFDIYNSQKEYSKNKIEKLIQKEKFTTYQAKTKHYLYELIIRAMRVYHAEKDDWNSIRVALLDADLLRKKRLYSEAQSILKKIKSEALEREWNTILMDVVVLEGKMVKTFDFSSEEYLMKMQQLRDELHHYQQLDTVRHYYREAMSELFNLLCQISKKNRSELILKADEIIKDAQFISYQKYKGVKIDLYRNLTYYQYFFLQEKKSEFNQYAHEHLDFLAHPITEKSFTTKLIVGYLNNLASLSLLMGDGEIVERCVKHIEKTLEFIKENDLENYLHCTNSYHKFLLEYYFRKKDFKNGLAIIVRIRTAKEEVDDAIDGNKATSFYYESVFNFFNKKYEAAIKVLNAVELFSEQQSVIHHEHTMLKILCHVDMNNIDSAVYLAKKHVQYIKQNELIFEQRKMLLHLLIKHTPHKKELCNLFLKEVSKKKIAGDKTVEISMVDLVEWAKEN